MTKGGLDDPKQPFEGEKTAKHHRHIGPGPKPGPKRAVNVSVDAEILGVAKDLGLNLSQTLEDALRKLTEDERVRRWQEEHSDFIESYNAYIARNGTLTEAFWEEEGLLPHSDDPSV